MQRRFVVTNLTPSSVYQLKVEAHNVAGSNHAEFTFVTLTKEGGKSEDRSHWEICIYLYLFLAYIRTQRDERGYTTEAIFPSGKDGAG